MEIRIKAPFEKLLEMKVLDTKGDSGRVMMPYTDRLTNPHGFVHGGAICSLADTASAIALARKYGERIFFTAKLDMEFKSMVGDGEMIAEAKIVKTKGKFVFTRIEVNDGKEKLLATGSAIFFIPTKK